MRFVMEMFLLYFTLLPEIDSAISILHFRIKINPILSIFDALYLDIFCNSLYD